MPQSTDLAIQIAVGMMNNHHSINNHNEDMHICTELGIGNSRRSTYRQRYFSSSEVSEADNFTYHGPLSQTLKNLKVKQQIDTQHAEMPL